MHFPPHGRRALEVALRKAAKFQVQVAAASSLDDLAPTGTDAVFPPEEPPARARKTHFPPSGRRALEVALRKAGKFQLQVASEAQDDTPPAGTEVAVPSPVVAVSPRLSARPLPHSTRARRALSSPRGQRALELALRKAAGTLARSASSPAVVAEAIPQGQSGSQSWLGKWAARRVALPWVVLAVCSVMGVSLVLQRHREQREAAFLAKPRASLEWLHQAQEQAADGSFRLALRTVDRALVDSPENSALLELKGDMHQSLFKFGDAQAAYEEALRVNPHSKRAHENFVLSRRLGRSAAWSAGRLSTLYGLHRAMLAQGRLDEAVAISRQLRTDFELSQATWQAVLDHTGLRGRVTVDDEGVMSLDLVGNAQPDLTLIQRFPVRRLFLAGTGLEDLRPLEGLPLETLDLSSTPVYDLTPLRGMPLEVLRVAHTGVVDLTPLENCPLRELDISGTRVAGVEALARMPLATLRADGTPLSDLRPLAALPLVNLSLSSTRVADLRPLQHLGLEVLMLDGTNVADLSPLRGSALRELSLANTPVADLTPLAGTPLTVLTLQGCRHVQDLRPLLSCTELEHLSLPPGRGRLEALQKLPHLRFIEGDDTPEKAVDAPVARNDPKRFR